MAGKIVASTINDDTGVLATQNGMTGIAKAWVNYSGATQTIISSFNVSSVTYSSSGIYTINMTTAMANANYAILCTAQAGATNTVSCYVNNSFTKTTTAFSIIQTFSTGSAFDTTAFTAVFGS
jgi:hypothetical protein